MSTLNKTDHIFLIGFMGAGKTTVGKALSDSLKRPFVDLDAQISSYLNCSISDVFREKGEPFFRDVETQILKKTASDTIPSVISTGGGIVLKEANWKLMNSSGKVIYLKAGIDNIWQRIKKDTTRPLLNVDDAFNEAKKIYNYRKDLYLKADFTVSTDNLTVLQTASKIQDLLFS